MLQPEPLDSGDLDAMIELERSRGYHLLVQRIGEEIERKREELEKGGLDIFNRGYIRALRMVLTVPGTLKSEISSQLEE